MASPLPPEVQLAAACAMWPPSNRRDEAIRAAAVRPLDWARFLRVVGRHRIIGLANDGLRRARPDVPEQVVCEISAQAARLVRQNLAMAAEALRLQCLFDEVNLPVLFVKGASLAKLAFGDLGLSGGEDIDLLVPYETLPAATALVTRAGYRRFDPPPDVSDAQLRLLLPLRKDLGFIHQESRARIELHWRLFLNPHAMPEASMFGCSQIVLLNGTNGLHTLGEKDLFAYLCLHGALHWWNRLKWLADVNALVVGAPKGSVLAAAEARGAGMAAAQAFLLCERLFGTALPAQLAPTIKSRTVRWMAATTLKTICIGQGEHHPHDVPFGTTLGSILGFFLNRNWRYRLAELKVHLTNQTDVLTLALPKQLRFLYPFLRLPLWAWRHAVKSRLRPMN